MKEEQLRIGNILHLSDEWYKKNPLLYNTQKIITVDSIDYDGLIGTSIYFVNGYDIRLLSPISLTEEWLKNFGFEWDGHRFNDTKNDGWKMGIYIIEGKIRWQFDMYNHIKIESVHQLQNLYYSLTERELVLAATPK